MILGGIYMIFDFDEHKHIEFSEFLDRNVGEFNKHCAIKFKVGLPVFLFGYVASGKSPLIQCSRYGKLNSVKGGSKSFINENHFLYGKKKLSARDLSEIEWIKGFVRAGYPEVLSIVNDEMVSSVVDAGYEVFMLHGLNR